ncbi:hypothetical protein [Phytomonospora endophytica]|uniref:Uncharacterized protein n=1 Tax=Phytomonospora endophytica TaxID=714109 RepID=A0A841FWW9_9ACTN|nr:hypothetical protein [Phytomonospora endophytica]MBB6038228.1 hypothetical protein [Phytomonospora endophytica]GIG67313.1 hypothetical protein Pen01_36080 [Phytomonospora endophytica]
MTYAPNTVTIKLRWDLETRTYPTHVFKAPTYEVDRLFAAVNDPKVRYIVIADDEGGRRSIRVANIDEIHTDGGDS